MVRQGAGRRTGLGGRPRGARNFFFASGERDEGEKEYRKAMELSKEKETLRIALAEHYLFQGGAEDSEKELNAVMEMNSQKARKVLAEIKLESGGVTRPSRSWTRS